MMISKEAKYRELLDELLELQKQVRVSRRRSTDAFPFAQMEDAAQALQSRLEEAVDTLVKNVLDRLDQRRKRKQ